MIHVSEINDAAELANHRLLWESLWQRTRDASYFQSFDWFDSYRRHSGPAEQLKVLVATLAAKPIGVLPLVVRKVETGVGSVRVLCYPQSEWGTCSGPIGPNSAATLIATMKYLREFRRDWDICDFRQVDVNHRDRGRTRNALRTAGMKILSKPGKRSPLVEFENGWTSYWSERSIEARRRYHQSERKLRREGRLEYVRFRPEERTYGDTLSRWDLFDQVLEATQDAGHDSPRVRAFLREVHSRAVRSATLDVNLLRLDGRAVATSYGFVASGQLDVIRFQGRSELADHACRVLAASMLQDGASRGDTSYRLGAGAVRFPAEFETGAIETERLTHFAPAAPRAQLLRWNQSFQTWMGRLSRASAALNI